ncbi:MAG: hypothetical protein D3909_09050 [Candidatus Electrothrix sp. ATG1]|nr:hypothetical protein [Candidatus Electrothrix sp. ATG1]
MSIGLALFRTYNDKTVFKKLERGQGDHNNRRYCAGAMTSSEKGRPHRQDNKECCLLEGLSVFFFQRQLIHITKKLRNV